MTIMKKSIICAAPLMLLVGGCDRAEHANQTRSADDRDVTSARVKYDPQPTANWLVGTWVPPGIPCDQDAVFMAFEADGSWSSPADQGTWRLNGNKLIRRRTGKIGDYDEPVRPVKDDHDYTTVIVDAGPDSFNGRNERGHVIRWQKCPTQRASSSQPTSDATEPHGEVRERWQQYAWQGSVGASITSPSGSSVSLSCDDKMNEYGVYVTQSSVWIHPKDGDLKGEMTANFIVDGRSHSLSITDGNAVGAMRFTEQEYFDVAQAIQSSRSPYFYVEIPEIRWRDNFSTQDSKGSFEVRCGS